MLMPAGDGKLQSRDDPELTLVCCSDQEFAMPLAVLLCSAAANVTAPWRVRVCIIDGGIAPPTLEHLTRTVERLANARVEVFKPDADMRRDLRIDQRPFSSCYLRLLMGSLLPEDIEKVIYLDCDMIVESDLAQLWRQNLEGEVLLAVRDFGYPTLKRGLPDTVDTLGCDGDEPYFNSGLMVVDLKRWREQRITQRVLEYTRRFGDTVRFGDQDGLNAVLWDQWRPVDLAWNVQVGALTYLRTVRPWEDSEELILRGDELLAHPRILHFVGGHKPWHGGRYKPVRGRFLRYLHQSRWFGPLGIAGFHAAWLAKTSHMAVNRFYQYLNPAAKN
jgi:lipopolysaccharide biosynthesis glycosyltransferase